MRLWIKVLLGIVALVLVLVAGAALFISQLDPNEYRGIIANAVEDATGRKLRIGGDLRITLLPVPSLEANDVVFANAAWSSRPDMLRIKRLRSDLALLPLIEGRLEIHRFDADQPVVYLETDAEGRGNWEFDHKAASTASEEDAIGRSSEALDILVRRVAIEKASITYFDGKTGQETLLRIDELSFGKQPAGKRVTLALRASYQNLPLTLDGKLGAVGAIAKNLPIEVDLDGKLGDARLRVEGAVGKPLQGRDMRLDVSLQSAATKPITDAAGLEVEELGPIEAQLRIVEQRGYFSFDPVQVSARPRGADARISGAIRNVALSRLSDASDHDSGAQAASVDLEGAIGEARFQVVGEVDDPVNVRGLRLNVSADAKATRPLTELAGIDLEEVGPLKLELKLLEKGGYFDLDDIVLAARPRNTDASMSGSVKGLALGPGGAGAAGKPAKVDVSGSVAGAKFSISGDVARPMEGKGLRLNVALDTKSTRALTDLAGVDVEELGPLDAKFTVIKNDDRIDLDAIDATARPRDAKLTIKGSIHNVAENPLPNLDLALVAKTLRQLDEGLPDVGPVSLSATARPRDKVIEIRELAAQVGKSDLAGSATVDTGGERPVANAKLRSAQIDLTEFAPPADEAGAASAPQKTSGGKVFPDEPLPLDALKKLDANVELAIGRLITRKLTMEEVAVTAKLDDGNLILKPALQLAGGSVGGTIAIDSRTRPAKFSADVDAKKVSIGALTKEIRGYETSKGLDSDLQMKLHGQGDSVSAILGGLDGDIRLVIGEGQVNNAVLDRVGADLLTQMISVTVPSGEKEQTTAFKCGVVRFAVDKGDAIADQTLVLETKKVLLKGGGLIDLKTEKLDLGAHLAARKGIRIGAGSLSSLMRVQGTLADPRLGTDLKGMVTTGARVGIAVATAGLSLLAESVYGHVSEDDQPCQTALDRRIKATRADYNKLIKLQ